MSKAQKHSLISVCVEGLGALNPGSWDKNPRSIIHPAHTVKGGVEDSHFSGLKRESDFCEVFKNYAIAKNKF